MENALRKRLEMIKNRARALGRSHGDPRRPPSGGTEAPLSLEEAVQGTEQHMDSERFLLVRMAGDAIAKDARAVAARFKRIPQRETWPLPSLIYDPGPEMARRIARDELCFLDIETTGLSPNTYLFLCGLMYLRNDEFVVEQLFARDYAEETAVLLYLRDMIKRYPMLVTYNGDGFDIPFIQTRMTIARIRDITPGQHVDLLEPAQRHFAGTLPNCKLETVERHLRGFGRTGDIPGRDIPDAYHEFVRSGDARKIQRILYHNRMDLLAMAYLVNHLARA